MRRIRGHSYALSVASAALAIACGGSVTGAGSRLSVSIPESSYVAGATIPVSVANETETVVEFSSLRCGIFLEGRREADGSWVTVMPPQSVCTMDIRPLSPGQSALTMYRTDSTLGPGAYRLAVPAPIPQGETATQTFYSPSFQLERPGAR
jgi:hypothetical protein